MKKYFAIAFVLLLVLLLVLRKQTEPKHFTDVTPVGESTLVEAATDVAPPQATPTAATPPSATAALDPNAVSATRERAKGTLAAEFTAQQAQRAEWDRYTSDLVFTGWEPPTTELNFKMGFLKAIDEKPIDSGGQREDPSRMTTDAFINQDTSTSSERFRYTPQAEKIHLEDYAKYCSRGCGVDKDSFELLYVMPLDDRGHVDVWLIDEKKEAKLVKDGSAPD